MHFYNRLRIFPSSLLNLSLAAFDHSAVRQFVCVIHSCIQTHKHTHTHTYKSLHAEMLRCCGPLHFLTIPVWLRCKPTGYTLTAVATLTWLLLLLFRLLLMGSGPSDAHCSYPALHKRTDSTCQKASAKNKNKTKKKTSQMHCIQATTTTCIHAACEYHIYLYIHIYEIMYSFDCPVMSISIELNLFQINGYAHT